MHGFYINLDGRTDRREHFEQNIKSIEFFKNIERFSAIEHPIGPIGCGLSHINALQTCLDLYYSEKYVCIFEDDFMILNMSNMTEFMHDFSKIESDKEWDVIVLTPRGNTVNIEQNNKMESANFKRIVNNQTATGYIMKQHIIPIIKNNMEEAVYNMINGESGDIYAVDQYWKKLQTEYKFYYSSHIFGGQLIGWSNNENRYVDYNDRFIKQNLF